MKSRILLVGCMPIIITGCATFAELQDQPRVDTVAILTNIECELANTYAKLNETYAAQYGEIHWLQYWATGIVLDLYASDATGGGATIGFGVPVETGSFGLGLGGGLSGQYEGQGTVKYSLYFDDLAACQPPRSPSVLTGTTGAGAWLARAVNTMDATGNYPEQVTYATTFTIVGNANGNAGFTLVPLGDGTIGGGLSFLHEQKDKHNLTLTFVPIKPELLASGTKPATPAPAAAGSRRVRKSPVNERTQDELNQAESQFLLRQLQQELDDE